MKKKRIISIFTALVLCSCLLFGGCTPMDKEKITMTDLYFDTLISVTLYGRDKERYIRHCFEMAKTYESYFSSQLEGTDIYRINHNPGQAVKVHPETVELLREGIAYSQASNGLFDITIGSLSSLWNFSDGNQYIPPQEQIDAALATVDASKIVIEDDMVTLTTPGSAIDLGGIAKGYIADRMKEYLLGEGVTSGIINLGGNILVLGPKENNEGEYYTVGIQRPFALDGEGLAVVKIKEESVVTSGIYQRFFEVDGRIYHHILDTKTGYPYDNGLASVTIISTSSVEGDALSTICFMMGLTEGLAYVESLENVEAVFVTTDEEIHTTSGIGTKIPFYLV